MSPECELVWTASDGRTHVERSPDPSDLVHRRRALEQWLALDGWVRRGRVTPPQPRRSPPPQWPPTAAKQMTGSEPIQGQRIIVRRGQSETFDLLARTFAHDPGVEIIWDRRVAERRRTSRPTADNRRRHERRCRPSDRWHRLSYLVVPSTDHPAL